MSPPPAVPHCEHLAKPGACDVRGCGNHPTDYVRSSDVAANAAAVDEARAATAPLPPMVGRQPFGTAVDASGVCDHGYTADHCVVSSCPNNAGHADRIAQLRAANCTCGAKGSRFPCICPVPRPPRPGGAMAPELEAAKRAAAAGENMPRWTPQESAARDLLEYVDLCAHEHTFPPPRPPLLPDTVIVCLDCGSSSVEPGAWRPPALHAMLRTFVEDVERAAVDRATHRPEPAGWPRITSAAQELAHEREQHAARLEELLHVIASQAAQREEHYLRQLEHGSRILERVVELVAPPPVLYRGDRLVHPTSELEEHYREVRARNPPPPSRGQVVELLELLRLVGHRIIGALAQSVPFPVLLRWVSDLNYPRAALGEMLARLDLDPPSAAAAEVGMRAILEREKLAVWAMFAEGKTPGSVAAERSLPLAAVDELYASWKNAPARQGRVSP